MNTVSEITLKLLISGHIYYVDLCVCTVWCFLFRYIKIDRHIWVCTDAAQIQFQTEFSNDTILFLASSKGYLCSLWFFSSFSFLQSFQGRAGLSTNFNRFKNDFKRHLFVELCSKTIHCNVINGESSMPGLTGIHKKIIVLWSFSSLIMAFCVMVRLSNLVYLLK